MEKEGEETGKHALLIKLQAEAVAQGGSPKIA